MEDIMMCLRCNRISRAFLWYVEISYEVPNLRTKDYKHLWIAERGTRTRYIHAEIVKKAKHHTMMISLPHTAPADVRERGLITVHLWGSEWGHVVPPSLPVGKPSRNWGLQCSIGLGWVGGRVRRVHVSSGG